ncbi:MAG: hypothetical protein JNL66_08785 [Alphaproteobacteria bacterium]|nr:hypothetical protein [Alphaproteobacteria bacterium]
MNEDALAATIDAIYDVATAPEHWPALLRRIGDDLGCHFGGMVATNRDRSRYTGLAVGVERAAHQAFLRRFHQANPIRQAAPHRAAGEIIESAAIIPRAVLERTAMYQAFFRPHDMGPTLGLTIWCGDAGAQTISLSRSWAKGAFDAHEHRRAQALMPHLRRMALVARHLRGADLMARSAFAALDAVPQATLLLDRAGRLVHANAAADALLRGGDGLTATRNGLAAATAAATRRLGATIGAAGRAGGIAGTLRLPRPSGRPALALVAMPMRGLDDFLFAGHPAVLVCVADPAARFAVPARTLAMLFGLTAAEADLATAVLAGQELKAIAAASGRSVNTVRNLLARLMAKTDTHRQSELLRVLDRLSQLPHDG